MYTRSWLSTITRAGRHGYTETKMNHALEGYTARIGKLDLHPWAARSISTTW